MSGVSQLLSGRVALVTGGGSGIGKAVSLLFAKEGSRVIVADIRKETAEETLKNISGENGKHYAEGVDVTNSDSVKKLFLEIEKEFCVPDILVNCAGITRDSFMLKMTEDMFDDVISVNLKGTYLMTQSASKLMIQQKVADGSIINVSSVIGKAGNLGQCNYAASKAGVEGFTKTVAKELARYNIRCNAVMPGFIDTPMVAAIPDKVFDLMKQHLPLGRIGKPEEVAEVCAFLASKRSSYITGGIIQVSGGLFM